MLAFGPSLHFARVGVGLRGVVTGNRHGWSVVRLWWFHPVRCFPVAHPRHSPSTLLVISPSSPCCFPVVSPLLPVVVSPSFLVDVSLLSHYSSSTSSHRRLLGRSSLSTRRVCPFVSSELLLVAELGVGHLVSATIITSNLESTK